MGRFRSVGRVVVVSLALLACGERTDRSPPDDALDGAVTDSSGSDTSGDTAADAAMLPLPETVAVRKALECDTAGNPAFGSCLDTLIAASCWDPDVDARCVDDGAELSWESGHRRNSSPLGDTFQDGAGNPCLELEYFSTGASPDVQFLSAGTDNVTIDETEDGSVRIICGDATTVLLTPEQAFEFFQCRGLVCQCPIGNKLILPCITNDLFCEDTGGRWEQCFYQCGEQVSCEGPGCNCGEGQNLVRGLGCRPDPSCD